MHPFQMLLSLWCSDVGVTRQQYLALREVLLTLDDISILKQLPRDISTLKRAARRQVSILPVQRRKIPVTPDKMPTLSRSQRGLYESTMRYLYFIDPTPLLSKLLLSPQF